MDNDELLGLWPDAGRILDVLLDVPPAERPARIAAECAGNLRLRSAVEHLLAHDRAEQDLALPDALLADPADGEPDVLPATLGPYRVVSELGRGGMSRVYRAERDLGGVSTPVALKLLDGWHSDSQRRRFDRERETLARLRHPNIAALLDGGTTDAGRPYLAMELVEGRPIDQYCDAHRLDVAARLRLVAQVVAAVQFAHAHLVVHRDIKPANVFVDEHGTVKLLDFGIAKWLDDDTPAAHTRTQHRVLTPAHAAPEQFRGEPVTIATDVYQLGLLLYRLLAGVPALGDTLASSDAMARAVLETDPLAPSQVLRDRAAVPAANREAIAHTRGEGSTEALARRLSGDLDAIVMKALRREPADRYTSVETLARDVDAYLSSRPVSARRGTTLYALRKYARRHRTGGAAASVGLAAALAGLAVFVTQAQATAAERDRAQSAEARAQALNAYMVRDLLAAATPAGAQGQSVTVADVLANASRSVGFAFAGQPAAEAEMRTTLAESYAALGQFAEAEAHATAALRLLGDGARGNSRAALRARTLTARLALERGRLDDARAVAEAVVQEARAFGTPADADALAATIVLANARRREGDLVEAERLLRQALDAPRTEAPDAWRLRADAELALADVYIDVRKGQQAEPLAAAAVSGKRARLGPAHPEVLAAMSTHGLALDAQLRFEDSLAIATELLTLHERVYGASHPRTARAHNNLAVAHDRLGRSREAQVHSLRAYEIYRDALGPTHASTLGSQRNVAIGVSRLEGPAQAAPIYRAVFEQRLQAFGQRHFSTIESAVGLVGVLARVDAAGAPARAAALELLRLCDGLLEERSDPRGLDLCATYLLEDAPADLRTPARALELAQRAVDVEGRTQDRRLHTLAKVQLALGDRTAAIRTMQEALAKPDALQSWTAEAFYVRLLTEQGATDQLEAWLLDRMAQLKARRGPDDPLVPTTERHLARLYLAGGRMAEAETHLASVLEGFRRVRPDSGVETGIAMSELGEVLVARGAHAEAEPLLVGGFESMLADRRTSAKSRAVARERVVRLYETWHQPARAEEWRRRSLAPP